LYWWHGVDEAHHIADVRGDLKCRSGDESFVQAIEESEDFFLGD
jgi:hypothetical protein